MIIPNNDFFKKFKETHGAFSCCEAIALYNILLDCPDGEYLELGSHKGKSALVALLALRNGVFSLVDPIYKNSNDLLQTSNKVAEVCDDSVELKFIIGYSTSVIPKYDNLAYCMVDTGDHGEELVQAEIKLLEDRVMQGGILAFHDLDNQFTAVRRGYDQLAATGKYEPISIDWKPIFDYARENNLEEGNNSWHEKGSEEFPKFVGALRRK